MNATKQFSQEDRRKIHHRIVELEQRTDAEVVCAAATESGRYDRAESLCGLLFGLIALAMGNKCVALGGWDTPDALSVGFQVLLVTGGFVFGSVLASYWHGLRRLFVLQGEMATEVRRSAHQIFSQQGIGRAKHRGGMLIYLSLFERRLEIRCDLGLVEKVTQTDLDSIRDVVLARVQAGDPIGGLLAGLDRTEAVLAAVVPGTQAANDTLSNELLLFHPRP